MAVPKRGKDVAPEGRPLQWDDFSDVGQAAQNTIMGNWGKAKSQVPEIKRKLKTDIKKHLAVQADPDSSDKELETAGKQLFKFGRSLAGVEKIAPHLTNPKVTLDSAAHRRTTLVHQGVQRAKREAPLGLGGGSQLRAVGAGWYFDHHKSLDEIAARHGMDPEQVMTASALMSPMNSPANERHAVASFAYLHTNDPVLSFSKHAQQVLGVGPSAKFSELSSHQASKLGGLQEDDEDTGKKKTGPKVQHVWGVEQNVIDGLGKTGPWKQAERAVDVLRGNVSAADAIDPHSSAKVWSYRDSISKAAPGTQIHQEYMARAQTALFELHGQQRLDLNGLKDSTEGILSPTKTTAEDTWMGAVSSGQHYQSVGTSVNKTSPAKFVASDKSFMDRVKKTAVLKGDTKRTSSFNDGNIKEPATIHAWHNEATIRGAGAMSRQTGEIIPDTLVQEVSWTEARRRAYKDDEYTAHRKAQRAEHFATGHKKQVPGQLTLF